MEWSREQNEALSVAGAWLRVRYKPFFYLAGYAGSGKSTLARHIAGHEKGKVAFAAFTGKAAKVMRQKGCAGAKTIHSLIYHTDADPQSGELLSTLDEFALDGVSLVVVDEVSMVNETVGKDLLSFGVPVLVLGDPAQLPPIQGAGYFTSGKPDFMLTDVHRQAKDSPIIKLATDIREGRGYGGPFDVPGLKIVHRRDVVQADVMDADAVIVGRNATRQKYNGRIREIRGFTEALPQKGETLICLRNSTDAKVFNGEIFSVVKRKRTRKDKYGEIVRIDLSDPDNDRRGTFEVSVRHEFFKDEAAAKALPYTSTYGVQQFTYGYAITCHKAQGSQWPRVCLFDESDTFGDDRRRWLYTDCTRASEHLTMVV
jgi:exodeoxyribonuclease-5